MVNKPPAPFNGRRPFRPQNNHRIRTYHVPSGSSSQQQPTSKAPLNPPTGSLPAPQGSTPSHTPFISTGAPRRHRPVHIGPGGIARPGETRRDNRGQRRGPYQNRGPLPVNHHQGTSQQTQDREHQGQRPPQQKSSHHDHRGGKRMSSRPPRRPQGTPVQIPLKDSGVRIPPPQRGTIRVIPIGGVEQVGRNLTVVEYEDDIIVVDAGMQFATDETPGVDYLLPNTTYLEERKDKVRALVVTHGHLDHIGAIPYLIERLGNPPVYTREFGAMLIKKRHDEYPHLPALNLKVVGADDGAIVIGKNLKVRFFGLTHSIPDSSGIMIETPFGDLIFTGDVRVENHDGIPDEKEIAQYNVLKNRNILLLAMDSTGIEKPGWSLPESTVIENVDRLVANAPGRVLIATFASQVERIIAFIEIAQKYNRKVAIDGRSMKANVEIVKKLKLSDVRHAIPMEEINDYPPNKVLMLATGAQGEEFASLMRMANGTHKQVKLARTDTIILSSSVIPGNERAITTLKDNLFRHDARIITYHDSDVHTSGHGKRGELEWIHRQVKYTYFMPIHGHHFMLKMHAELSRSLGCPQDHIVVPDNGTIVEISDSGRKIKTLAVKAPSSPLTVDGFSIGDIQDVVIRDRQMLAEEGMFVIVASVNASTGKLRKSPDIISRGFVYLRESQDLLREVREVIKKSIEDAAAGQHPIDFDYVKSVVTDQVSKFLLNRTAKRPIVIPVILGF